jgi:hypothetical protein
MCFSFAVPGQRQDQFSMTKNDYDKINKTSPQPIKKKKALTGAQKRKIAREEKKMKDKEAQITMVYVNLEKNIKKLVDEIDDIVQYANC